MNYPANELDLLEGIALPKDQPYLYFHLRIQGQINTDKLSHAIRTCINKIPQLGCYYDQKHNCWEKIENLSIDQILYEVDEVDFSSWELQTQPQLLLQWVKKKSQQELAIGISHIVTDGNGAMQLLQLFCACYRGEPVGILNNERELVSYPLKDCMKKQKQPSASMIRYKALKDGTEKKACIREFQIDTIKKVAAREKATVNDVLLCAYMQLLYETTKQKTMTIPCPVNLRAFIKELPATTITNFTGDYKVTVSNLNQKTWQEILQEIHLQMKQQRKLNGDLNLIRLLHRCYHLFPLCISRQVAKLGYQPPDVSFTNLGVLAHDKIYLDDCDIIQVSTVTRIHQYPFMQFTASTYRDICSITCHVAGTKQDIQSVEAMLGKMGAIMDYYLESYRE